MSDFKAELRSLAIGSLPHSDPASACQLMLEAVDIPTWPQLPKRSPLESMYTQFGERFPGLVVKGGRIYVDRDRDLDPELERLYIAYLMDDQEYGAIGAEYAAGLHRFLSLERPGEAQWPLVKGQVTGPVSWGLVVVDQNRRPVLYDDLLAEATAKHLRLKANWMEQRLRQVAARTIVFVDEPYMSSFGSAFISLSREQAVSLMEEVLAGISGLKGVHCCGNTDWSLLLETTVDILSLDAYGYAEALALYPEELGAFLKRGGMIAWGVVPAGSQIQEETVETLVSRFREAVSLLTAKGLHQDDLLAAALITPSCGCGALPVDTAEQVLRLTGAVSQALRARHG